VWFARQSLGGSHSPDLRKKPLVVRQNTRNSSKTSAICRNLTHIPMEPNVHIAD
jgi:hypothetical protein